MNDRVFVSHSHLESELCDPYVEAMQRYGFEMWYDRSAQGTLQSLDTFIEEGIQACNCLVVLLTPSSIDSYRSQLEIGTFLALAARDPKRFIIPVRLADCDVPILLQSFKCMDAFSMPFESAIHEIAQVLGSPPVIPLDDPARDITLVEMPETVYPGHSLPVTKIAWSPDGSLIVSVSRERSVHVWDPKTGKKFIEYQGHGGRFVYAAAWSPDGTRIVSGDSAGIVRVWSTETGGEYPFNNTHLGDEVYDVDWSSDNIHIAVARASNTVQICDSLTGNVEFTYHGHVQGAGQTRGVLHVAWSPDSMSLASIGWDKQVRVWEASTGKSICVYSGHGNFTINNLVWSPEGTRIATVGSDGTLQIWNSRSGQMISLFRIHTDQFEAAVSWSPIAPYLASVGSDATIRLWNATKNSLASSRMTQNTTMRAIAWSPNGQKLAVANDIAKVQIWSVRPADLFGDLMEQSEHLLNEGYLVPAAVICGSILESYLRSLSLKYGVEVANGDGKPKSAGRLNDDLPKVHAYSALDQKEVTAWLAVRNMAAHGHIDEVSLQQVKAMIAGVRNFIARNEA